MSSCPKCQKPLTGGLDSKGWATCRSCGNLWRPAPTPLPARPGSQPSVPKDTSRPRGPSSAEAKARAASAEYLPEDVTPISLERPLSTARLTVPVDRVASEIEAAVDAAAQAAVASYPPSPAEPAIPPALPEFDVGRRLPLDEGEAPLRRDSSGTHGGLPAFDLPDEPKAPGKGSSSSRRVSSKKQMAWPGGTLVRDGHVQCPLCGHAFAAGADLDTPAQCPQCFARFSLRDGAIVEAAAAASPEQSASEDVFERIDGEEIIGRNIGGVAIDRKLGEGGMGTVYHGRQISLDREVAVKILAPELTVQSHFMHRFTQEARSLAQINHPNILHVYDFGEDRKSGLYFMVMEYIKGKDVADLLQERHRLTEVETLNILYQSANGLQEAAAKGIIHRDIKPDNLMLAGDGVVKVTDFGLAKNLATITQTNAKIRVGTPAFMSPEQCDGDRLDLRSDMYSLGCTAYVALTGRLPYEGETPFAIMLKHKADPVPRVRSLQPNVDARLDVLIFRLMAKKREDRFTTWADFIDVVRGLLDDHGGPTMNYSRGSETGMQALPVDVLPVRRIGLPVSAPVTPASDADIPRLGVSEVGAMPEPSSQGIRVGPEAGGRSTQRRSLSASTHQREETTSRRSVSSRAVVGSDPVPVRRKGRLTERSEQIHLLCARADLAFADNKLGQAIQYWKEALKTLEDIRERERVGQRIAHARSLLRAARRKRLISTFFLVVPLMALATWQGWPYGHAWYAEGVLADLDSTVEPQRRPQALQQFLQGVGSPSAWYVRWVGPYAIPAADRARVELQRLEDLQKQSQAGEAAQEAVARLAADLEQSQQDWFTLEQRYRALQQGERAAEAQQALRGIAAKLEPKLAQLREHLDRIEQCLNQGQFTQACQLATSLVAQEPRLGVAARNLPLPVLIEAVDQLGRPLAVEVLVNDVQCTDQPPIAWRCLGRATTTVVRAEGFSPYETVLAARADPAPQTLRVTMQPGLVWQVEQAFLAEDWLQLQAWDKRVLMHNPSMVKIFDPASGEQRFELRRSEQEGRTATSQRWSRFLAILDGQTLEVGGMDGSLWDWKLGSAAQRRFQGNLPVRNARRSALPGQSQGELQMLVVENIGGQVLEAWAGNQNVWRKDLGPQQQDVALLVREHTWLVITDHQVLSFDETGQERSRIGLPGERLGPVQWFMPDMLLCASSGGIDAIRVWADGEATTSRVVDQEGLSRQLVVQRGIAACVEAQGANAYVWLAATDEGVLMRSLTVPAAEQPWIQAPALASGQLVLCNAASTLVAFGLTDGTERRRFVHDAPLACPPVVLADRLLVVADVRGRLSSYHLP